MTWKAAPFVAGTTVTCGRRPGDSVRATRSPVTSVTVCTVRRGTSVAPLARAAAAGAAAIIPVIRPAAGSTAIQRVLMAPPGHAPPTWSCAPDLVMRPDGIQVSPLTMVSHTIAIRSPAGNGISVTGPGPGRAGHGRRHHDAW